MTRQRARYLRRATDHRRCPNCHLRALVTDRCDVTSMGELPGRVYIDGRTTCRRCGLDASGGKLAADTNWLLHARDMTR